jgi:hypothetical protein
MLTGGCFAAIQNLGLSYFRPAIYMLLQKSAKVADTHFVYREEIITNLAFLILSF